MKIPIEDELTVQLVEGMRHALTTFKGCGKDAMRVHVTTAVKTVLASYRITRRRSGPAGGKRKPMSDEEWFEMLKKSPAYEGIDIQREFEKCKVWAATKLLRGVSRRRFVNWLNKISEKPVNGGTRRGAARHDVYTEPEGWREVLRSIGAKWDPDKLDDMGRGEWSDLPMAVRTEILKAL